MRNRPKFKREKCQKNPKKKRGRPSTGFDKRAYMKEYMRKRRLALKQDKA